MDMVARVGMSANLIRLLLSRCLRYGFALFILAAFSFDLSSQAAPMAGGQEEAAITWASETPESVVFGDGNDRDPAEIAPDPSHCHDACKTYKHDGRVVIDFVFAVTVSPTRHLSRVDRAAPFIPPRYTL